MSFFENIPCWMMKDYLCCRGRIISIYTCTIDTNDEECPPFEFAFGGDIIAPVSKSIKCIERIALDWKNPLIRSQNRVIPLLCESIFSSVKSATSCVKMVMLSG